MSQPVTVAPPVPTPADVFPPRKPDADYVCRLRVAGGLVYDSRRTSREEATRLAERVAAAMYQSQLEPVVRFDVPGYPVLAIATKSIATAEAVPADMSVSHPLAKGGAHR